MSDERTKRNFTKDEVIDGLRQVEKDGLLVSGFDEKGEEVWADARIWENVKGVLVKKCKAKTKLEKENLAEMDYVKSKQNRLSVVFQQGRAEGKRELELIRKENIEIGEQRATARIVGIIKHTYCNPICKTLNPRCLEDCTVKKMLREIESKK